MRILDGAPARPARPSAAAGAGRCAGTRVGPVPGPLAALAGTATRSRHDNRISAAGNGSESSVVDRHSGGFRSADVAITRTSGLSG